MKSVYTSGLILQTPYFPKQGGNGKKYFKVIRSTKSTVLVHELNSAALETEETIKKQWVLKKLANGRIRYKEENVEVYQKPTKSNMIAILNDVIAMNTKEKEELLSLGYVFFKTFEKELKRFEIYQNPRGDYYVYNMSNRETAVGVYDEPNEVIHWF